MEKKLLLILIVLLAANNANAQCWSQVAPGWFHNVTIQTDGTLWAWGRNDFGQLGDGTNINRTAPVQIGTASDWAYIDSGDHHTVAIKSDGTLWAWGQNDSGQLGDGTFINRNAPLQIGAHTDWQMVSLGTKFTLALKTTGELWGWGATGSNQLGTGNSALNQNVPIQVGTDSDWITVAAGANFGLAIKANGTLWGWGDHNNAALANGLITGSTLHPTQSGSDSNWIDIATGNTTTLALKINNTLWSWGGNTFGALGTGAAANDPSENPVAVGNPSAWNYISMGRYHSYGIKPDKSLWVWGRNNSGQIGDGTTTNRFTPVQIGSGTDWRSASGGDQHTLAISEDHSLWAWGGNAYGQLGDGSSISKLTPTAIGTPCSLSVFPIFKPTVGISPNPFDDFFTVITNLSEGSEIALTISNILGQRIGTYSETIRKQPLEISLEGHPRGVYFITITSENVNFYRKVIKR